MKHFKLSANTKINTLGIKLFQVELTIDCKFGKAGDLGGWVEEEENLQGENAWIYSKAEVCLKGEIRGGVIRGGVIWGGVIWGGEIRGGVIRGGVIRGGVIRGGVIWGGVIWGGEIRGGVIWGGVIRGGVIWGGEIWGGVIWGGVIWGGEIRGGVIRGGEIWGGEIRGGEIIKSPLQIQGSKHFCIVSKPGYFRIGCNEFEFQYWNDNFIEIGENNNYTKDEIEEYGVYISIALKIGNNCFKLD